MWKSLLRLAIAFVVFVLLLCSIQCTTKNWPTGHVAQDIYGEWDWRMSTGGYAGGTRTPESEGYNQRLVFKRGNKLYWYRDDELLFSGRFDLVWDATWSRVDSGYVLHYGGNSYFPQEVRIEGESLILAELCYDCYYHVYFRNP